MEEMEENSSLLSTTVRHGDQGEEAKREIGGKRTWRGSGIVGKYLHCVPKRYVFVLLSFLGFVNVYALRVNLSVAVVQMDADTASLHNGSARIFNWTPQQEGWVLAAFFYGYLITQIPGGMLAQAFGGKWVFGIGIVMTSVLTLFTPLAAYGSVWALVAVRVLEGLFEGVTFPCMHSMLGVWAPNMEISKLSTIVYSGTYVGTVISFPLSALLCQYGFDGGWPSVFYVFGGLGIVWFVAWALLVHSSPATHPTISLSEKLYIEKSISENGIEDEIQTPWFEIFTSPSVWAIVIVHLSQTWGFYTLLTCMPLYFKQALGLEQNDSVILTGVYSAIPYTLLFVVSLTSGQLADYLRSIGVPTVIVRKAFTTLGMFSAGSFILICGYLGNTSVTAVLTLTLAVGFTGFTSAGYTVNVLDIAPRLAGALMGIINLAGTIPGIVGPQVAKAIAVNPSAPKGSAEYVKDYKEEWREVFIIAFEVYMFGMLVYLILASGEKQPWAEGGRRRRRREGSSSGRRRRQWWWNGYGGTVVQNVDPLAKDYITKDP